MTQHSLHSRRIGHWIDGRETPGTSDRTSPVYNPATGQQSAEVQLGSSSEVNDTVAKAVAASKDWRHASLSKRSGVLFAFRQLLLERTDELAAIVTAEHGKVLSDSAGEIARGLENVEFAAGVPQLLKGHPISAIPETDKHPQPYRWPYVRSRG